MYQLFHPITVSNLTLPGISVALTRCIDVKNRRPGIPMDVGWCVYNYLRARPATENRARRRHFAEEAVVTPPTPFSTVCDARGRDPLLATKQACWLRRLIAHAHGAGELRIDLDNIFTSPLVCCCFVPDYYQDKARV